MFFEGVKAKIMGKNNLFLTQLRSACSICKKDILIYYLKSPVLIFSFLAPFFLLVAFMFGRNLSFGFLLPVVLGLSIFFTSSSVGPIIVPWETRMRTLEKLISCPISLEFILLGDILAGFIYGAGVTLVILMVFIGFSVLAIENLFLLIFAIILSNLCFSCLGILISIPPTDNPSNIMMLSNLVKFPLVFISGIFVPVNQLPFLIRILAKFSPLTYTVDLLRCSLGKEHIYSGSFSLLVIIVFTIIFFYSAIFFHKKNLSKRF